MKSIDFSQPGGFPLTQDQLGYLQESYTECLGALALMNGNDTAPFIISGCVLTKTYSLGGSTICHYDITAGWIFYNGGMMRVSAITFPVIDESLSAVYVLVTNTASPLAFNNGSNPNVILDVEGSFIIQPIGTAADSTHLLLSRIGNGGWNQSNQTVWNSGFSNTTQVKLNSQMEQVIYYTCGGTGNFYYSVNLDSLVLGSKLTIMAYTAGITGTANGYIAASGGVGGYVHEIGNKAFTANWMIIRLTYVGNGGVGGSAIGHNVLANYDGA